MITSQTPRVAHDFTKMRQSMIEVDGILGLASLDCRQEVGLRKDYVYAANVSTFLPTRFDQARSEFDLRSSFDVAD